MSAMRARRMSAGERRDEILAAATSCFAERGYAGTTTSWLARAAGVNEALLFRHFGSKQQLYLACVDAAWQRMLDRCDELFEQEPDARHWRMPGRSFLELVRTEPAVAQMWMRGLVETTGNDVIDDHLARRMREVHEYVSSTVARSADAGGLLPGRSPDSEAWTIIALGLLGASLGTRGLVRPGEYDEVLAAHREWVTGSPE
jgi:AcrR family transcriptional regulator